MARPGAKRSSTSRLDLDEIAPNRFFIHNTGTRALLKGEGEFDGQIFEMTTWRREGLLARLRERGFVVRTIGDRIDALPRPPAPSPIGVLLWRPLATPIEQFSHFDLRRLRWHPLALDTRDGAPGVAMYDGWVLRRRKGRAASSYYLVFKERGGGAGLRPLDETKAMLMGYAQALALDPRPWLVEQRGDELVLPDVELPPPYHAVLASFAHSSVEGWLADRRAWPLVQDLFDRLGARLQMVAE
jgi:hypothetical protein